VAILRELNSSVVGLCFNPDHEKTKIEVLEKVRPKLNYIRDFVGDKQFALGYLTLADFYLSEQLAYFEALFPSENKHYGFWWRIRHNFEELPEIQAYYKRPDAVHGPYLPPSALINPAGKKVKLGYWGIRGLAQVPRLLLSYNGVEFEDVLYSDGDKWFKEDKQNLGLDFPNLPYLLDGEYNLTESSAVERYIIKKWGKGDLLGKDEKDNALLEAFLSIFVEIATAVRGLFFNKDYVNAKGPLLEKYKGKLEQLEKFVGEKKFVLGYLTLADFIVAEQANYIERLFEADVKPFTFLARIRENFNQLPEIEAYYKSEKGFKGRFFPASAALSVERE
jgi:glutathione S-transferase